VHTSRSLLIAASATTLAFASPAWAVDVYSGTGFPDISITNLNRGYNSFRSGAGWFIDAQPATLTQDTAIDTWNIITVTDDSTWSNTVTHDFRLNVWVGSGAQTKEQAFLASPEVGNAYMTEAVTLASTTSDWGHSSSSSNLLGYYAEHDFSDFVLPAGDYLW
jgi:hypothetical protein